MRDSKRYKRVLPVQLCEYAAQSQISKKPAFAWWLSYVIKKREQIIVKVKSKYWIRTHKFGIKVPKTLDQEKRFDEEDGNTLWSDAIIKEMANVKIAFELFDREEGNIPPNYQQISCHMIFDIKLGETF